MSEQSEAPVSRGRRGVSVADLSFLLPNAITGAILETLSPAERKLLSPGDCAAIQRGAIGVSEEVATIVAMAAEKGGANGEA